MMHTMATVDTPCEDARTWPLVARVLELSQTGRGLAHLLAAHLRQVCDTRSACRERFVSKVRYTLPKTRVSAERTQMAEQEETYAWRKVLAAASAAQTLEEDASERR